MHADLRDFLARMLGTIAITLVPVALTAFLSMPYSLQSPPGNEAVDPTRVLHMT